MKKSLIFTLLLGASGYTYAQSSVTLYGILDEGVLFNSNANGKHLVAMQAGAESSERWGIRGDEDLGGSLHAIFRLENGFTSATGAFLQGGDEFGRAAYVGMSNQYGTITLGRRYPIEVEYTAGLESGSDWAGSGTAFGAHPGDADNLDGTNRTNNELYISTTPFRGLLAGVSYNFGNQAGSMAKDQMWSLGARYESGPVIFAAAYLYVNSPNYSLFGDKPQSSSTGNNIPSVVTSGYASANAQKVFAVAGAYTWGIFTAGLVYSNSQFSGLGSVAVAGLNASELSYRGTATLNTGEVNMKIQATPTLLFGAAFHYTHDSGVGSDPGARYQQVNLGVNYTLSKRTMVYGLAIRQWASGVNSTGAPALGAINSLTPSSNSIQTMAMMGFVHKF